jgi:hypothetical protein
MEAIITNSGSNKRAAIITVSIIGLIGLGFTAAYFISKKNKEDSKGKDADSLGDTTGDDKSIELVSNKSNDNGSSLTSPSPSKKYMNDGSDFKFTNMPTVYGNIGANIYNESGNKVGSVKTKNQLLGAGHSVEHKFVIYTDRNGKRYKVIFNGANVINGQQ